MLTWPARTSVTACAPPLYGTLSSLHARRSSRGARLRCARRCRCPRSHRNTRWGCALAAAMNSSIVLNLERGVRHQELRQEAGERHRPEIALRFVGRALDEIRRHHHFGRVAEQDRIAVRAAPKRRPWRRSCRRRLADSRPRPRSPRSLPEPLADDAGDHVARAARGIRDDQVNGLRRIGLGVRGARHADGDRESRQCRQRSAP